ncbi:MAG: hypothetical protein V4549_18060 [Bacteroidota bacterium]
MKTIEDLEDEIIKLKIEIEELTDALKESDGEVNDLEDRITDLENDESEEISSLKKTIEELEQKEFEPFDGLIDNQKYNLIMDNFDKITIQEIENLLPGK